LWITTDGITPRDDPNVPTIVQALGLEPTALDAVRAEGTPVLPEVIGQILKK
jgi:hypothetical protein